MGTAAPILPCLDLTKDPKALEPGTPEWGHLCLSIRETLENHGGLLVNYDKISDEVKQMFAAMPSLFDVPLENKRKNKTANPYYYTYSEPSEHVPYYEAVGVMNPVSADGARAFTQLMWPHGNEEFCQTLHLTSTRLMELFSIVLKMIFDSYCASRHYESQVGNLETMSRMTRYTAPSSEEPALGLPAHCDGTFLTILCQNDVNGLEFQSKDGEWFSVNPRKGSFIVFVGQALKDVHHSRLQQSGNMDIRLQCRVAGCGVDVSNEWAWSNGRLYAVPHKVTLSGDKDRLSCGLFVTPKGDQILKVADELIDDEHPPIFKSFTYQKFLEHCFANEREVDPLQKFAGI